MSIPRFLQKAFKGYEVIEVKEFIQDGLIEIYLNRREEKDWCCHRCGQWLSRERGKYRTCLEGMPIMGLRV